MKHLSLLISVFFTLTQIVEGQTIKKTFKLRQDQFDRVVLDENGKKINYSLKETEILKKPDKYSPNSSKNLQNKSSKGITNNNCDAEWKYSIMGTSIGRKSMNSVDIDGDGITEIVCSASNSTFGSTSFWYILKYNTKTYVYEQVWSSDSYENYISRIKVFDINKDGKYEILIGFGNGSFQIINAADKSVIKEISTSESNDINDIEFDDADNDGKKEIVVSTDNNIYLYDTSNYTLKKQLTYGAYEFCIGNVDTDADNEIVTSNGNVILLKGNTTSVKWTFKSTSMIELSDIDKDGMKEVICAPIIYVYDVDKKSLKFQYQPDITIQAILLKDIDNDGIDEIIYGDDQWGEIHFINSVTHLEMFKISNPKHGVTAINIADVNNDGKLEVMWGAGWTSTGADYLYVADISSRQIKWTSVAIDGPFYAVATGDVDNDKKDEIIAVSYESGSGYDSGILSIFDGTTKELKWQSDGNFFPSVWTGIYDVKINDVDNDGNNEIIVAAGDSYTGKIWVVNGISKTIKSSYEFGKEDLSEFKIFNIADVDNDGTKEFVVYNGNLYIISSKDYSIKYSTSLLSGLSNPQKILIEDIDNDGEKEIIIVGDYIYVMDGNSHQTWESSESGYSSFDLYDINGDGKKDIVVATKFGFVHVYDGVSLKRISSQNVSNYSIDNIAVSNLNEDKQPEYIFSSNGSIYIYADSEKHTITKKYGTDVGKYNSLCVADVNNDNKKEIIFGNSTSIILISDNCYKCTWFSTEKISQNISCRSTNDGFAQIVATGNPPYSYNWNNGKTDSIISNLASGTYIVTTSNSRNCSITDTLQIQQAKLSISYASTNESCNPSKNGSIVINIIQGKAPFSYKWSNDSITPSITNLSHGSYSVSVTDSLGCTSSINNIILEKDTLFINKQKTNASCFGLKNGSITVSAQGTAPYKYSWDNGSTSKYLSYLSAGKYIVTVTDSHGCKIIDTTTINEPPKIETMVTTTPDTLGNKYGDGTATVNAIGGFPPYTIKWNDPFQQTTIKAINLTAGTYIVTVKDKNGCIVTDTAIVKTIISSIESIVLSSKIKLYPNPTNKYLYLKLYFTKPETLNLNLYNIVGRIVYSQRIFNAGIQEIPIDMTNLNSGIYNLIIENNDNKINYLINLTK